MPKSLTSKSDMYVSLFEKKTKVAYFQQPKKKKYSSKTFSFATKVYVLFGIDIDNSIRSSLKSRILQCTRIAMTVIFMYVVYLTGCLFYLLKEFSGNDFKANLAERTWQSVSLILWLLMQRSSTKMSAVVKEVKKMEDRAGVSSWKFGLFCMSAGFSNCISQLIFLEVYSKEVCRKRLYLFTFTLAGAECEGYMFAIFIMIEFLMAFMYSFLIFVVALYWLFCRAMEKVILCHVKKYNLNISWKNVTAAQFKECYKDYRLLLSMLHSFEEVWSFTIFLVFNANVMGLFYSTVIFFIGNVNVAFSKMLFVAVNSLVGFYVFTFLAGKVNEADVLARKTNSEMLQRVELTNITPKLIQFMDMNNRPVFVPTLWGMFELTRSFYFVALGGVLTYALLIVSIQD